jgi:hypothetical protein
MTEPNNTDEAEEEKKTQFNKSREYRRSQKLLKQVVKAPPMKKHISSGPTSPAT